MSKHNAYLKDENLLTLFSLNNLIVPEIQREYVWGNNSDVLEKFLSEIESKAAPCEKCHHVHTNKNINVGFLYSYKPAYVKYESERILDEFLIDGQQRMTTLFLLLLYRATKEERIDDFIAICRAEETDFEMGFNYKVRSLTQQFLVQLIQHAKNEGIEAFDFISDLNNSPYWFLDDYKNDPTVKSMISALRSIKKIFDNNEIYYFDYLLINIHFWHFKTEATSQGEELYITMNSRGEQLADNEMQKARTLPSSDLPKYGQKWESWQTFFWRNRANNPNADKGFNNFLACVDGLENFNEVALTGSHERIKSISIYMNALLYICSSEFKNKVSNMYKGLYINWFDSFKKCLWNEINNYDGKWDIIDPRGGGQDLRNDYKNKSITRNKTMLFWSWMTYFKKCNNNPNDELLIRILHFYYIRYQCFKRSSTSIDSIINCFIETNGKIHEQGFSIKDDEEEDNINSKTFSEEEILLSKLYYSDESKTKEIESSIWEIQDLPYFIDGKDVGGNTIFEFFSDDNIIDRNYLLDSVNEFRTRIKELLGKDINKCLLKRILLFYKCDNKAYWIQQSPWYYNNYETSTWKRIIRTKHFICFYKEYSLFKLSLDKFLEKKRKDFFKENSVINIKGKAWSHRKLLILYDIVSDGYIWDGAYENIAFWKNEDPNSTNEIFIGQDTIWKAKRYYEPNAKVCLKENWQNMLTKMYNVQIIEQNDNTE
jgi:hypothetical protein